jgi:hypothetical protein
VTPDAACRIHGILQLRAFRCRSKRSAQDDAAFFQTETPRGAWRISAGAELLFARRRASVRALFPNE